jgi:hypothetical protein
MSKEPDFPEINGVIWWNHEQWETGEIKKHCAPPLCVGIRRPPYTDTHPMENLHEGPAIVVWGTAKANNGFERTRWGCASMDLPPGTTKEERQFMCEAFLDLVKLRLGPKLEKKDE